MTRWYRPLMFGLTVAILIAGLMISWAQFGAFVSRGLVGVDLRLLHELGRRWAEDGTMYLPYQFGPYSFDQAAGTNDVGAMPGLYPPIAGPVFAALRFLPAVLWWAIPLAVVVAAVIHWRPVPWAWPLMAAVTLFPNTAGVMAAGNSTMWVVAGVSGGFLVGWPILVVALKPTFAPLLLIGVRHRSFWIGAAVLGVASLVMLGEWGRYLEAIGHADSPGVLYSFPNLPLVLLPVIAWSLRRLPEPARLTVLVSPEPVSVPVGLPADESSEDTRRVIEVG